jgi:hypothetical protein
LTLGRKFLVTSYTKKMEFSHNDAHRLIPEAGRGLCPMAEWGQKILNFLYSPPQIPVARCVQVFSPSRLRRVSLNESWSCLDGRVRESAGLWTWGNNGNLIHLTVCKRTNFVLSKQGSGWKLVVCVSACVCTINL